MGKKKVNPNKKKRAKIIFVCEQCGNPINPSQHKCNFCGLWRGKGDYIA